MSLDCACFASLLLSQDVGGHFDALIDAVVEINPGLSFLEQDALISHLQLDSCSGDEVIRIAGAMHEALDREDLAGRYPELADRLSWFLRDFQLVGSLVVEAPTGSGQLCSVRWDDGEEAVDCYILAIVLSGLLRRHEVSEEVVREVSRTRRFDVGGRVDAVRGVIAGLLAGGDDYRITPHEEGSRNGRTERQCLDRLASRLAGDEPEKRVER